jgi:hypothetical protein
VTRRVLEEHEHVSAWSHTRQGLGHGHRDALTALRAVVGVYSSHPTAPLALAARCKRLDGEAFASLEADRKAVRIVGMRGSAFLVPTEVADDIIVATRRANGIQPSALRARGLDPAAYAALKPRILDAATEPLTPAELRRALGAAHDDQRPYMAMRLMAREGSVIRVGTGRMRTDDLRWVATAAWLGRPLGAEQADPEAALGRLAAAYLDAYGPARPIDFAWWAGVARARASAAVASVATVDVGGGLLLPAALEGAWRRTKPVDADAVDVLPKWDAYMMGYAPDGRTRFVDDAHLPLAYSTAATRIGATAGDGLPLILRGGRAVATWTHRLDRDEMAVTVTPFSEAAAEARRLLEAAEPEFEAIGRLFEAQVETRIGAARAAPKSSRRASGGAEPG